MTVDVQLDDGVRIQTGSTSVDADARRPDADVAVCSHAHSDHVPRSDAGPTVCSSLTADLAGVRYGHAVEATTHPEVDLLPAGHVAGSRAAVIDDGEARVLYTGDVCTRDRCFLEGFDPPDADVLVVEATYGDPGYSFPDHDDLERSILDWLDGTIDRPVVCHGYALGRAQKLQHLVGQSDRDRCLVTDGVATVNEPIETELGLDLGAKRLATPGECSSGGGSPGGGPQTDGPCGDDRSAGVDPAGVGPGDAVVCPAHGGPGQLAADLVERAGALRAGFSGWAVDASFRYRGGYDATFPLTDHCDFEELIGLVAAVDPDVTYTQHGFADELARQLSRRGFEAWSLERGQTTIADFVG